MKPISSQHFDGISIAPVLVGKKNKLSRRAIYWHYPHYHSNGETPVSAILKDRYKLIQHYEDHSVELYDIFSDISENKDLTKDLPKVKKELLNDLEAWKKSVRAELPEFK
jgi:arylsulfatase A-like enzyme